MAGCRRAVEVTDVLPAVAALAAGREDIRFTKGKYDGNEEEGHEESDRTETGPAKNERLGRGGEGAF